MNSMIHNKKLSLTGTQLKMIAIIAMLVDHIAWKWFYTYTLEGQLMHVIGRLTAPIMCYFIAQGYIHTKSFHKYLIRLAMFAIISHIPYVLESTGEISLFPTSVIYTLALGLIAIYCYDKISNKLLRWLAIIGVGILSLPGDWMFFGIAFCLVFYIYRDNFKKQCIGIISVAIITVLLMSISKYSYESSYIDALLKSLFQLSVILSLPLLALYNGVKGGNQFSKWGFYVFYPLHLLILALI